MNTSSDTVPIVGASLVGARGSGARVSPSFIARPNHVPTRRPHSHSSYRGNPVPTGPRLHSSYRGHPVPTGSRFRSSYRGHPVPMGRGWGIRIDNRKAHRHRAHLHFSPRIPAFAGKTGMAGRTPTRRTGDTRYPWGAGGVSASTTERAHRHRAHFHLLQLS